MSRLTDTEFRILIIIVRKTFGWIENPDTGMRKSEDWISRSQLQSFSGRHTQAVSAGIQKLQSLGLIDIRDSKGNHLLTPQDRRGKRLFYRFSTSMVIKQVDSNMFDNQTLKIKHTKETNTKVSLYNRDSGIAKKQPACPLLNGSPLKAKYPNGHQECVEYFTSVQDRRGFKFINPARQFACIHSILKAEIGFDKMDRAFPQIEKKYGHGNWDFSTLSSWLEKGAANG